MKKSLLIILLISLFPIILHAEKPLDFDGDGKTDFIVSRPRFDGANTLADWFIAKSNDNSLQHYQWGYWFNGANGDFPVMTDYDGDNKTDIAVYRPGATDGQQGVFYILNSASNTVRIEYFGVNSNMVIDDPSVVGDYDGDGKADIAIYRPTSTPFSNMFIYKGSLNNPSGNLTYIYFGSGFNMVPVKGDFDGDGKRDVCIQTLVQSGLFVQFVLRRSSDGGIEYINWGKQGDSVFTGDYDGDGKSDFVAQRNNGSQLEWYILERDGGGTGANPIVWGRFISPIDVPIYGGDYDGDGKTDIVVYRKTNPGTFIIRKSSNGGILGYQFGNGDTDSVITRP